MNYLYIYFILIKKTHHKNFLIFTPYIVYWLLVNEKYNSKPPKLINSKLRTPNSELRTLSLNFESSILSILFLQFLQIHHSFQIIILILQIHSNSITFTASSYSTIRSFCCSITRCKDSYSLFLSNFIFNMQFLLT